MTLMTQKWSMRKGCELRLSCLLMASSLPTSNVNTFLQFPWGRESFLKTIYCMKPPLDKKDPVGTLIQHLKRKTYKLQGFPLALQLVAFQAIPLLLTKIPAPLNSLTIMDINNDGDLPPHSSIYLNDFLLCEANPDLQVTPLIPLTQPIPVIDEEVEDEHVSYMENLIAQKNEFYSLDWPGGDVSVERVEAVAPTKLSLKPKKKKGVSVEHVEAVAPTKQSLKPKKNLKPKKKKGVSVEHVETVAPTKLSLKPKKKKGKKISSARKRLFNKRLEEQVNHLSIQVANLTSLTSLFKKILSRRHGFRSARNSKFTTTCSSGKKHDQVLPPLPHEEENHHILDVAAYNHLNNDPDHHMTFPTDHLTPASPTKTSFSFDEPFEEVIYPKGDPYVVSICKSDVDLLQPETFVNDTIIDFYINYLKNQIQGEERPRLHFFNSFLFRKLADLDKDPSSIADGKATFLRVRKWTRKVDMFGKDYIFVPVNFNLHWILIIICHPGEVANCTGLDFDDSTKVPCILHMDSVKGSHAGLENLVQRFMNLRFVSLEVPQQENSYDCGLFLLHYLELFLAEAPQNFSPFKIHNASNFLYLNWFPPAEASSKRTLIEKLIFELLENHSREVNNEQNQSCESPVLLNNNTEIEVLSGRCTPLVDCKGSMTQTQDQGIDAYRSVNPDPKCQSPAGQTLNPDHDHLTCTPDHITFPTDHHLAPVSSTKTSYGGQSSSSSHQNISDHMQRDPPSPKNPDHTCQSIDTPAGPAANQSPKGLGFNARATVLNAFTAKATTSPGHNTGFNPKATTSNTPYIPDELVCLSDSCEARKKPKHIPTEPERILATHLLKCQTVPAKTVIGYVDNNLWELFYKTIKASKNVAHLPSDHHNFHQQFSPGTVHSSETTRQHRKLGCTGTSGWCRLTYRVRRGDGYGTGTPRNVPNTSRHMEILMYTVGKHHKDMLAGVSSIFVSPWLTSYIQKKHWQFERAKHKDRFPTDFRLSSLVLLPGQKSITNVHTIYAPMIWADRHWVGLAINLPRRLVEVLDPLPELNNDRKVKRFLDPVLKMLPFVINKIAFPPLS
ncbi:hypothetical protein HID58_061136, partial [Brassica napus]